MENSCSKHLCSPAAGANVSDGGGSSSVFTRALHAARAKQMYQRKQLPGSAVSNSKRTSAIKGKKVIHGDRTYDVGTNIEPPSFNLGMTQDIEEANMVACTPGHDISKRSIKPSHSVKSPFLSKQHSFVRHEEKALDDLYTYATAITEAEALKKIWVHISQPVPMSLSLHDIQQAIHLDTQMQEETFNVAVQMFATAGDDLWNPEDHLPSFKDDSLIPYDVPSCHLECMKLAFPDWDEDIPNWVSEFPSAIPALNNRLDCAFHVLYYMRNWDATHLDQRDLRKEFLSNLLSFKNNELSTGLRRSLSEVI
uniref:Ubiquitin-like protease family profile domain-containing protein n=1 Tax=Oryza punctata TaxID=4537 RepID=A0A0E0KGT4_ORYPU